MLQEADRPIAAYTFATFALLLYYVDTFFQWRTTHQKSQRYLRWKVCTGAIISACVLCLIFYVELGSSWEMGLWGLLGLSIHVALSAHVRAFTP
jgi:hypothetical protein